MSSSTRTATGLRLPRWLLVALALGGSALPIVLSYGGLPTWLTLVPTMYLVFVGPGVVAALCLDARQRGMAAGLMVVAASLFTLIVAGVVLNLFSLRLTGRSLDVADVSISVLFVAGAFLWYLRRGAVSFWSDQLGPGSTRGLLALPRGQWQRGAVAAVAFAAVVVAIVVTARAQHPQAGVPFSSLEFVRGDAALDGQLSLHPSTQVSIPLELDTAADISTADVSASLGTSTFQGQLHRSDTGKLTGELSITAPAETGRVRMVISTVNPTYVNEAPISNPGTVIGSTAESADSSPLLELVLWVDVT